MAFTRLAPWLLIPCLVLVASWSWATEATDAMALGINEEELTQKARSGRLGSDELIRQGEKLPYFTKLRLYLYSRELEPFFEGLEDSLRDLARADPDDTDAVDKAFAKAAQTMGACRERLRQAQREDFELEWRRGLTGLIFLDFDWRKRIREQGKDELKNPYDLVAIIDCLDAELRGLSTTESESCREKAVARTEAKTPGRGMDRGD